MFYGLYLYGWPLLLIILGPLMALNCLKALREREGMYDQENSNYMLLANWAGVLIGFGAAAWSAWRLYRIFSALFGA